jgi:hypothetical protein
VDLVSRHNTKLKKKHETLQQDSTEYRIHIQGGIQAKDAGLENTAENRPQIEKLKRRK